MNVTAVEPVIERFRRGERLALARLLTLAGDHETSKQIRATLEAYTVPRPKAVVVAFTGNGGVGKSTLIGRIIELLRSRGKSVAVIACDPQSPVSGGALLGDRIRMNCPAADDGVFIRSVATGSGSQGIAPNIELMTELLVQFGFEVVLLETAGAGQGDTAVRQAAGVVVLLVQPEAGDELQWEKAGVLEIADIVAVNKADLPSGEQAEAQLRAMLHLPGCRAVPVVRVSGRANEGVEQLWAAVESVLNRSEQSPC
jgi:LAO/AO transport system kinase